MSSTDDIRSPYSALKPPVEKFTEPTISELIMLNPSCCPLLMSCGRYTSIPLIYTLFSSYEPPRTIYCELISFFELTPAIVVMSDSTPLPPTVGINCNLLASMACIELVCFLNSVTCNSPSSWLDLRSLTFSVIEPLGFTSCRFNSL